MALRLGTRGGTIPRGTPHEGGAVPPSRKSMRARYWGAGTNGRTRPEITIPTRHVRSLWSRLRMGLRDCKEQLEWSFRDGPKEDFVLSEHARLGPPEKLNLLDHGWANCIQGECGNLTYSRFAPRCYKKECMISKNRRIARLRSDAGSIPCRFNNPGALAPFAPPGPGSLRPCVAAGRLRCSSFNRNLPRRSRGTRSSSPERTQCTRLLVSSLSPAPAVR